ncbi:MAG: Chemotaxis protein CheY [Candidatus Aerophobetes bacterium ADurb.Bin490]|nr:MAG: Chemotaxis protein CheY [Candidatus Aerophobetes bacterium ADurb.Bin490]HNZ29100.1 response regulator [Candidatus Goldiibacteriota bacterium]HPI03391.1 response regulator [Candidatus Goldiibacteriota bacterium]HPN63810.1 response regulator [Candidatus Goldiibacteriota bacterium]HRQ42851.1 response regulator [Candidatus Goldiibacteriota bacterium]
MAKRILIADDAAFMRMMLKNILTSGGYEVVGEAGNGREAVELYKKLLPDMLISDMVMPEMGGIDTLREIMKDYPAANVLICSAIGQQALVIEAIQAGAKDYIVKPFEQSNVLETVRKIIGA